MALVRFGGGVSEIRGSIAGNVFSRSGAGAIVRNRAVPVNPNTTRQSEVRGMFQNAVDGFNMLNFAEVSEWNSFAGTQERINRLGETYKPSGKQLYTETAMNLSIINGDSFAQPSLSAIEGDPNLPALEGFSVLATVLAGELTGLSLSGTLSLNATHIVVQATPQLRPTWRNAKKFMRQIAVMAAADPLDVLAGYTAVFGDLVTADNVIHVRARALNSSTGLGGAWIYSSGVIEA